MANVLTRALPVLAAAALGALVVWVLLRPVSPQLSDSATVVEQMREVAQLETLDASLYKRVTFTPEPRPRTRCGRMCCSGSATRARTRTGAPSSSRTHA
ncbi:MULTISPECIES: hypothetical protein [Corallococcus]|uniref:hypothetical protein n=1 Tax=Corallococcus TaxID=83461 RepID=UPI0027B9D2E7|nr:hypothetical protein [Corallococcus exiguus]